MINFKKIGKKNISLIGLMGSGKSSVGREISKYFNVDFHDSDLEIEKMAGQSINLIFKKKGEKYFRELEEKVCLKLLSKKNCVISLGGGSVINERIRRLIFLNSFSIYLKVDIEILLKRLSNSNKRPLLKTENKENILIDLLNERKVYYDKADLILKNNQSKNYVISLIENSLNQS